MARKLKDHLHAGELLRMYAKSYPIGNILDTRHANVTIDDDGAPIVYIPSIDKLYEYKVVVTTLGSSTWFARGLNYPTYAVDHFSHIFIDECGSTTETTTLIPIAGVCTSEGKIHAKIILAGDTKQLGPVVFSMDAKKLGHHKSFLERICSQSAYKKHSLFKAFDRSRIVQLTDQYRAHSAIMEVSSRLFYEGELRAVGVEGLFQYFECIFKLPTFNDTHIHLFVFFYYRTNCMDVECTCFDKPTIPS